MRNYVIRRILFLIPTLFLVTVIVFLLVRFVPGDAIDILQSNLMVSGEGVADRAAIEKALGLDKPIHVQYVRWIGGIILHGDFGNSLRSGVPVLPEILNRLPITFELGFLSIIVMAMISLPIGLLSAIRQDSWGDYFSRTFAVLMLSIPSFWLGTLIMIFPPKLWGWSPPMELIKFTDDPIGNLGMFILPAIVLGVTHTGATMRVTRTMMLEVLRQDYIRTGWSKGLSEKTVIMRHAAKNALIPVVTVIGGQLPLLIGGSVIIEQIFSLPGMGRLLYHALINRDYAIISAVNLFFAGVVMIANLIIDMTYPLLDPRVTYK